MGGRGLGSPGTGSGGGEVAAGRGVRRIGAGACWRGGRHHRGEEEEEENNIPEAQPAPGGKSLPGVWEQGRVGAFRPTFRLVPLSLRYEGERKLESCFSQLSSFLPLLFLIFVFFNFLSDSIECFSMRRLAKQFLGRCDGSGWVTLGGRCF